MIVLKQDQSTGIRLVRLAGGYAIEIPGDGAAPPAQHGRTRRNLGVALADYRELVRQKKLQIGAKDNGS